MGIRVGMPILKLSKDAKATKRKGDARKIALEALSERYTKDEDIDRNKSKFNEYTGFQTGKDLYKYWITEASGQLDAKGRKLKSTAVIGYQLIVKPDMPGMENMSEAEKVQFVRDGMRVAGDILQEHGLQIDATALHRDEKNPHGQILGHDPEYKAGKKIDIRLYGAFNREFPKRMRALGYDVESLNVYDPEKAEDMTEEEKEEYKKDILERKKAKKKQHGRSSNQFKADKLAEQEKALQEKEQALQAREDALRASVEAFERSKEDYRLDVEKERTEAKKRLESEMKREHMRLSIEADNAIKAYKAQKQSEVDRELEAEKQQKLESLKSATGAAYAAQMDYQSATKAYNAIVKGLSEKIIQSMNQLMIKSGGKPVPVGDFYAKYIRNAVEGASAVDGETMFTEHTARQNMSRAEQAEAQFSRLNEKMNQRSDTGYSYEK